MNPFEDLIKGAVDAQATRRSLYINVGEFTIDTTLLLTDDLAAIFIAFAKEEDNINELVEYATLLPYSIKIDLMFYLGSNKKAFKKLKKIKSFNKFVDGFAAAIADLKLQ